MKKKSLSVKKIIPNHFNFKKILKDKKILKTYKEFTKSFENLRITEKIAIAVSGGSDSMALCFLASCYKSKKKNMTIPNFYLVDHGLRKESAKEAQLVKRQLKLNKINLKILKWRGKKPNSNIQSLARKKRYELLFNECKKSNITTILTAHHKDDIFETFFIRLLRGSGTEGLSSFIELDKEFFFKGSKITVVRPLLNISKQNLRYITQNVFNFYVEDQSNEMDKFQRVRIRKLISNLEDQGLDFQKLKLTIKNLGSTNNAINELVHKNISKNVTLSKKNYVISSEFFLQPEEIVFRSLSLLIKKISNKVYPPRGKKIVNLIYEIKNSKQFKATLGGTIIEKIHNSVKVTKEKQKNVKFATI